MKSSPNCPPTGNMSIYSENALHAILDSAADGIITISENGIIELVNKATEEIFGYSRAELIGQNVCILMPSPYREEHDRFLENYFQTGERRILGTSREVLGQRKTLEIFPINVSVSELFLTNGKRIFTGIIRDISTQRASEEALQISEQRYRAIVEDQTDLIVRFRPDGLILFINEAFARFFNQQKDEIVQTHFMQNVFAKDYDNVISKLTKSLNPDAPVMTIEHQIIDNHGEVRWLQWTNRGMFDFPLFFDDDHVLEEIQAVGRDITERKRVEHMQREFNAKLEAKNQELDAALMKAQAATQAKSNFLATMSHEIRTPLNGVLGMLTLVNDSSLTDEQHELVTTAINSGQLLLSLINDILDFSKIEAGRLSLEQIDFEPRRIVKDITDLLSEATQRKGLYFHIEVEDSVPQRLRGDPTRLSQVLNNLIGNAIKFTHQGGITIRCQLQEIFENNTHLIRFEIQDTGIGISEVAQSHIFDPFTQADGSTTRQYGGTGLGLAIVKQLVTLMGGQIGIHSKMNEGSVFWFTIKLLPAQKSHLSADDEHEQSIGERYANSHLKLNRTEEPILLVVDDNRVNQTVASRMLNKLGYAKIDIASSGLDALKKIQEKTYDLIFMDCQMPELDGYETTRRIRLLESHLSQIPIIAMTANAMTGDRVKCIEAGMDDYISKPIVLDKLSEKLTRWLGKSLK